MVVCKCIFLDGKEVDITIEKEAKGSDLFASVCKYLGLKYLDPFGIVFRGGAGPAPYNWWVRTEKTLRGQIPGKCKVWEFAFIVKYYPKTLVGMDEEVARFHVIMQIRQDLLTGRLKCPAQTMAHLCSYWLQAQYGDWSSRHIDLQLADAFRYVQRGEQEALKVEGKCDIAFEEQMMQIHQAHNGMSTREADFRFIRLASSLPNYGIHYYPAYDPPRQQQPQSPGQRLLTLSSSKDIPEDRGEKLTIGVGPLGIHQYKKKGNEIVFTWKAMRAVSFKRNRIVLRMEGAMRNKISGEEQASAASKSQKSIIKEYCLADMYQTKIIWQAIIEYHMFFRMADQKGLKGEDRKQMISSLKIKRTIPLVGEKRAEAFPSRSRPQSRQQATGYSSHETSPKRSSSVPVRKSSAQQPRPSSPLPVPHKVKMRRSVDDDSEKIPRLPLTDHEDEDQLVTEIPSRHSTIHRALEQGAEGKPSIATPASYASTPRSGTFLFPAKSPRRQQRSVSQTSTSGEEVLDVPSDGTDNTDVLCSPNILHNTFSYSEDNGVNNIGFWQDALTPRGRSNTPRTQRVDKTPNRNTKPEDGDGERSATPSPRRVDFEKTPIVIPAEILVADLKETARLRSQGGYQSSSSSDFPMELDYVRRPRRSNYVNDAAALVDTYDREFAKRSTASLPRRPHHANNAALMNREFTSTSSQIHDREFEKQSSRMPLAERRAQSMHSLRTASKDRDKRVLRDRSTSPKRGRHTSPLQRRAIEGNVVEQLRPRPEKRGYSERAYSESRLAHKENRDRNVQDGTLRTAKSSFIGSAPSAKRRSPANVPRRRNIASWSQGDDTSVTISTTQTPKREGSPRSRKGIQNTIPKLPIFIRSVV